jgi:hypothetical protein
MVIHPSYSYTPKYADTPISGDAPISGDTTHMGSKELMAQMASLAKEVASNLNGRVCVVKPWLLLNANGWFAVAIELIATLDTTGEKVRLSSDTPFRFHISLLRKEDYKPVKKKLLEESIAYMNLLASTQANEKTAEGEYEMGGLLRWSTENYKRAGHSECLDITLLQSSHLGQAWKDRVDSYSYLRGVELERRLLAYLHHIRHLLGFPTNLDNTFHLSIRIHCLDDANRSDGEEEVEPKDADELNLTRDREGQIVNLNRYCSQSM